MDDVWNQTVDSGKFTCRVIGDEVNNYRGKLIVTVTETGKVLLEEDVGISYGAPFGPDVADVQDWQDKCIAVIDAYIAEQADGA